MKPGLSIVMILGAMKPGLKPVMEIGIWIVAYAALLGLVKTSLSVVNKLTGGLGDFVDKAQGYNKQLRGKKRQATMERAKFGNRFKQTPGLRRLNTLSAGVSNVGKMGVLPGMRGQRWRANMHTAVGTNTQQEVEKNMKDNADFEPWKHNDNLTRAASETNSARELRDHLTDNGYGTPTQVNNAVAQVERVRKQMSAPAFRQMTALASVGGGTAHANAGEAWATLAAAAGTDDSAAARLTAQGRTAMEQGGRIDWGGGGFGASLGVMNNFRQQLQSGRGIANFDPNDPNAATDRAAHIEMGRNAILDSVIDSSAPGKAVYGKPGSAEEIAGAYVRRLNNLTESLSNNTVMNIDGQDRVATERDVKQVMAAAGGIYDAMGAAAPQNARRFANGLNNGTFNAAGLPAGLRASLALNPDGRTSIAGDIPMLAGMENLRVHDQAWAQTRRDIGASAYAQGQLAGTPGTGGPPQPPNGPVI
jgi:hypothetical protein